MIIALLATMTVYSQQTSSYYQVQIEQLNRQMTDNMIRGDFEKNLDLYTSDAISLPSYEPMKEGLDAIKKSTEDMLSSGMKITSFETKTSKLIPGGDLITEIGTYRMTVIPPGSSLPVEDHGKYLNIWEKQADGSLKIKVETWNSDLNPMQQTQPGQTIPQAPVVPQP